MTAVPSRPCRSGDSGEALAPQPRDQRKTTDSPSPRPPRPRPLDAGPFAADVASFELHLAAENKAAGTIRIHTETPRWFAAAHLLSETRKTRWEQVDTQDVQLAAVARGLGPRVADPGRDLPDGQAARRAGGREGVPAPVPASLQPHLAGLRRGGGRLDGAERLVVPADAPAVRRQRTRGARASALRPRHGRLIFPAAAPSGRPGAPAGSGRAAVCRELGIAAEVRIAVSLDP
jgi:hypothetical protein